MFGHGDQRVDAVVVLRAIHVEPQRFAIGREGMAVGAGRDPFHHHAAVGLVEVAQPPFDQPDGLGRQRRDYAFVALIGHQRHIAIEDRRAGRVSGSFDVSPVRWRPAAPGHRRRKPLIAMVAGDSTDRFLMACPECGIGRPGMRGGLLRGQLGRLVVGRNRFRIDLANAHRLRRPTSHGCRERRPETRCRSSTRRHRPRYRARERWVGVISGGNQEPSAG